MKLKQSQLNINQLLNLPTTNYQKFHRKTKIEKLSHEANDPDNWPTAWKTVFFKDYPRLDKIILPEPTHLNKVLLESALRHRTSNRNFSKNSLELEQLSNLLYFSAGLKKFEPPWSGNRFYPSAGSRYPLEIYLISQNTDLPKGLYHYNLKSHSVEALLQIDTLNIDRYFNQDWLKDSSCLILFTAIFYRNTMKYGERGYRHIIAETGIVAENFYLNSTALELKCCGIGGYNDDLLHELLDIDGINESIVFALAIGT